MLCFQIQSDSYDSTPVSSDLRPRTLIAQMMQPKRRMLPSPINSALTVEWQLPPPSGPGSPWFPVPSAKLHGPVRSRTWKKEGAARPLSLTSVSLVLMLDLWTGTKAASDPIPGPCVWACPSQRLMESAVGPFSQTLALLKAPLLVPFSLAAEISLAIEYAA